MDAHRITVLPYWPNRIVWGIGSASALRQEAEAFHPRTVMVVTDEGMLRTQVCASVLDQLSAYDLEIVDNVQPNPSAGEVEAAAVRARCRGVNLIVALGGGSPVDAAKGIAVLATHPGVVADYDIVTGGDQRITAAALPVIAVPTTAGTGTEVSEASVITIGDGQRSWKMGMISKHIIPKVAIMDPASTVSMPPALTAATGVDALTHAIEAYVSDRCVPFAEAIALRAIEMVGENLPRAVFNGQDMEARHNMLMASMMAGMAVNHNLLGLCHAMAHQITTRYGVPHGVANAILLPHVMAFNLPVVPGKMRRIAEALGERVPGTAYEQSKAAVTAVARLCAQVGVPRALGEVGARRTDFPALAEIALSKDRTLGPNPRKVALQDIVDVYYAAF